MTEVIVIGAGAAGLAAAKRLSEENVSVTLLEARSRTGGRIHTMRSRTRDLPVELGAEFVHGSRNAVWDVLRAARLRTHEVPNRHWRFAGWNLSEDPGFWDHLSRAFQNIDQSSDDQDVKSWLEQKSPSRDRFRQLAFDYVEGFHAAPAERMSLHGLAKAESAAERDEATRTFRVQRGYSEVTRWLLAQALSRNTRLHLNTIVKTIRWERGRVEVEAQTRAGVRSLPANCVLVTVPLGVLKKADALSFEPALPEKQRVIDSLEMGQVVKVTIQFRSRFWPVENFGFIHSDEDWLPTWWSDERGLILNGWTGGPRAEWLGQEDEGSIVAEAFRSLSRIFKLPPDQIADSVLDVWRHDWMHDGFTQGAYSYPPVCSAEAYRKLAEPVKRTLFFAGEATDNRGEQGTVHAAIASGNRAAEEILRSLRRTQRSHCIQH